MALPSERSCFYSRDIKQIWKPSSCSRSLETRLYGRRLISSRVTTPEPDAKTATVIRKKEHADFEEEDDDEKEPFLVDTWFRAAP